MNIQTIEQNNKLIAKIEDEDLIITDLNSALDLMATVNYEVQANRIILNQHCIVRDFFILSTGLAGDILQKYITYGIKLAIVGDFSIYTSKPLHDFIWECNRGKDFFFVPTEEEALFHLSKY